MLPWRKTDNPYSVWISEIMLQQTRVDTVIPYYLRFLERFPSVDSLARAPLDNVLKLWENLGYYSRARHLHAAARQIVERFSGRIPAQLGDLLSLPGIGRYTAGAILSIAFGEAVSAVDGNVRRVVSRLCALEESIDAPAARERIEGIVLSLLPEKNPGGFNQALMELGALVCLPKKPSCSLCPLHGLCRAEMVGRAHLFPVREKRRSVPHREVAAAVIRDGKGRALIVQRPAKGLLGSLWKFPGGILNAGESTAEGLARLVRGELGVGIAVGGPLHAVNHAYTHFRITLTAFSCALVDRGPSVRARLAWRWAEAVEMEGLSFSKADRLIARAVFPPSAS
jgi:A/G-specific adenine glycosylase